MSPVLEGDDKEGGTYTWCSTAWHDARCQQADVMIMSLFSFRNPMTGVALVVHFMRIIGEVAALEEMLDALVHHGP